MGANAQTTDPTFTSGQVLTADQQNQSARTGVPVFAGTTERDAAFGGTGEKTLAEGQLCYLESTNVVQYYDGAAWATVGPTTAGALVYITGASFTTQTSVSLSTNTFTSTYRNYLVIFDVTNISADSTLTLRMRASGTDNSSAVYNFGFTGVQNGGGALSFNGVNQTSATVARVNDTTGGGGLLGGQMVLTFIDPQTTNKTTCLGNTFTTDTSFDNTAIVAGGFSHNSTTQFDAISVISSVASSMTGVYRVYGYADS